jgi:hypothetical protein
MRNTYKLETRFFLVTLPAVALITLSGWAKADSGIVKGPGLSLGNAKQRTCQIVERTDDQGNVKRKVMCDVKVAGKKGK